MGHVLKRKIIHYEDIISNLEGSYISIRESAKELEDFDDDEEYDSEYLYNAFELLLELDVMLYRFYGLKSYFDIAKVDLTAEQRAIVKDIDGLRLKYERKLPLADLIFKFPELAIIRRQLMENAREVGKITYQCEQKRFIN